MSNFDKVREKINNTEFILCDISAKMCFAWDERFDIETNPVYKNLSIFRAPFSRCVDFLMNEYPDKKIAIVSPANSYGLMDGGYDKAIIDYFGKSLRIPQTLTEY